MLRRLHLSSEIPDMGGLAALRAEAADDLGRAGDLAGAREEAERARGEAEAVAVRERARERELELER